MSEYPALMDQGGRWPNDLREWVDERTLISFVLNALHSAECEGASSSQSEPLPPGLPRVLLSLLLYSYVIGLRSSEQIVDAIEADSQPRYLCANTTLCENELRGFRRHHRAVLEQSLTRLLERIWNARPEAARSWVPPVDSPLVLAAAAAQSRINEAIFADTISLDR